MKNSNNFPIEISKKCWLPRKYVIHSFSLPLSLSLSFFLFHRLKIQKGRLSASEISRFNNSNPADSKNKKKNLNFGGKKKKLLRNLWISCVEIKKTAFVSSPES